MVQEPNAQAGFTPYARAILGYMSAFYGASVGDLIATVAVFCPMAIAGDDFVGRDPLFDNDNGPGVWVCCPSPSLPRDCSCFLLLCCDMPLAHTHPVVDHVVPASTLALYSTCRLPIVQPVLASVPAV